MSRSLRPGIVKELTVPKYLKIPTLRRGSKHVTINMKSRNFPWISGVIGSSDVGIVQARKENR